MVTVQSIATIARVFGCSEDQARAQLRANANTFRKMAEKAAGNKNGKHKGYTQTQLEGYATAFWTEANQTVEKV